jgi:NAD(P)-dependent dehydrogenase (short-subunit alcohol dehydrogenase family)
MRKVILITGGSRGIGAATARLAGERGYDVAVNYTRDAAAAEAVVGDVRKSGGRAVAIKADVSDPSQIKALFTSVDRELGRLDAFFNNAGVLWPHARFVDIAQDQLAQTLALNLTGAFLSNQEAVRRMSTRHGGMGGVIVNMSSMASRLGGAFECVDYAVSKGAIDTMTVGLAKELASEGIRVNGVRPGLIHTDIHKLTGEADRVGRLSSTTPMRRGGKEAVLWLCSDAASYITGVTVDVAGGRGL